MSNTDVIIVKPLGQDAVILFAAEELARYLGRVTGQRVVVDADAKGDAICLGLMSAFADIAAPEVPAPYCDDAIYVDVGGARGAIAGINPRSVLLAVYRYLTELGCRWVRPGVDGEIVPRLAELPEVRVAETPSYRHRAVCIEGAVSYEHVRDMVDWLPKVGLNGYYIQFREAHTFFNRWYQHLDNPNVPGERLTLEKAVEYTAGIESEITRRGLLYHKVGHGWTCEPFGIHGLGWEQDEEPPAEIAQYLAEVNGERTLWGGIALNTNLCYSNPEVRRIVVEDIVRYAGEHPDIDYVHFWLADGTNNNCECAECRKARPADFYVMMLNELDAALTARGLATRIVFLIYVDLLWPPEREVIRNPERFVLMFAPIVRTYSEAFRAGNDLPELPPYVRNRLEFPKSVDANVAFLKAWQAGFGGDSFDFDYHLMWDHTNDPGHYAIAKTVAEDMKGLRAIGLNGFVSCQIQRIFFPTGLAMAVMARNLWNTNLGFDTIAEDYFTAAFGADGNLAREYVAGLSERFDPMYLRGDKPGADTEAAEKLATIPAHIDAFRPVIEHNRNAAEACHRQSWFYLDRHAALATALAEALATRARGDRAKAAEQWAAVRQMAWDLDSEVHPVFDAWLFTGRLDGRFR
ncbi:MAG TPA: DUF4838 domain-containing protein [Candidatus Hydrogenedentes bacterium]|nr:DUF4838 domain-containing protein [Candidatus Hydrogenedentota bacterium]HPG69878.1 DUF4838 domain-containing protein [Candidatus Hydrogenedentota bacterium]